MIIKSFQAETSSAALKMVRAEMGGDAVVLKTRKVATSDGANGVEVTACLDKPSVDQASKSLNTSATVTASESESTNRVAEIVSPAEVVTSSLEEKFDRLLALSDYRAYGLKTGESVAEFAQTLRRADFSERWIQRFIEKATSENAAQSSDELFDALANHLESLVTDTPEFEAGDRIAVVGLPGSGKTSLIGALAWQLTSESKQTVKLATLDSHKIGARDEIACFSELLGVDVFELSIDENNENTTDDAITLIDTSALTEPNVADLSKQLEAMNTTFRVLVVSSLTRTSDLLKQSEALAQVGPTHIAMTMTDLTSCLSGVIELAEKTNCKLAWHGHAENGNQAISPVTTEDLMSSLRSVEVRHA